MRLYRLALMLALCSLPALTFTSSMLLAFEAIGQDRTVTLRAANVAPTEARVVFLEDGGCSFAATAALVGSDGERQVAASPALPFNGARCATLRAAAAAAGRRAFGVGDGGLP